MPLTKTTDEYWSELYDIGRDFTLATSQTITKFLSYTTDSLPKTCLDIGCGTGQLTRELHHRGYACVGVDVSESAVGIARSLTVVPEGKLQYVHFDIERDALDTLPQRQFALVTCKLVYAFIKDKDTFINRVKSLLQPGGVFIVITPHIGDMPAERREIAVDDKDLKLLSERLTQVALYKGNEVGNPLTYFVGRQ